MTDEEILVREANERLYKEANRWLKENGINKVTIISGKVDGPHVLWLLDGDESEFTSEVKYALEEHLHKWKMAKKAEQQ